MAKFRIGCCMPHWAQSTMVWTTIDVDDEDIEGMTDRDIEEYLEDEIEQHRMDCTETQWERVE